MVASARREYCIARGPYISTGECLSAPEHAEMAIRSSRAPCPYHGRTHRTKVMVLLNLGTLTSAAFTEQRRSALPGHLIQVLTRLRGVSFTE